MLLSWRRRWRRSCRCPSSLCNSALHCRACILKGHPTSGASSMLRQPLSVCPLGLPLVVARHLCLSPLLPISCMTQSEGWLPMLLWDSVEEKIPATPSSYFLAERLLFYPGFASLWGSHHHACVWCSSSEGQSHSHTENGSPLLLHKPISSPPPSYEDILACGFFADCCLIGR